MVKGAGQNWPKLELAELEKKSWPKSKLAEVDHVHQTSFCFRRHSKNHQFVFLVHIIESGAFPSGVGEFGRRRCRTSSSGGGIEERSRTVDDAVDRQPHRQQPGFHRLCPEAHLGGRGENQGCSAQERKAKFEAELAEGEKAKADLETEVAARAPFLDLQRQRCFDCTKFLATEAELNALNASRQRHSSEMEPSPRLREDVVPAAVEEAALWIRARQEEMEDVVSQGNEAEVSRLAHMISEGAAHQPPYAVSNMVS